MTKTVLSDNALSSTLLKDDAFRQDWQCFNSAPKDNYYLNGQIEHYINGKDLACPMPLLKLKMALKQTTVGNAVYLTATDPNSECDIAAFCQHAGYGLIQHTSKLQLWDKTDTIFHSIITKSC